ncbi:MAG: sigma-70 family RNA polymerase sigma factor [Porticoccaceae bacterium]|nr:sigma-70 family RNA polymerase sigma factor [Porticoccaceae bacterium]
MKSKLDLVDIFHSSRGIIARVLRRYCLRQVDIDDILQETILRALEAEKRTDIQQPRSFLVGVAKNVARAELRRKSKNLEDTLEVFDPEKHQCDKPSVESVVDARHRMEIFAQVVAELPPQCRKVFVLKHVYGVSHKEISRKLGIAVSTVEKHVSLGLRKSRLAMLEKMSEHSDAGKTDEKTANFGHSQAVKPESGGYTG